MRFHSWIRFAGRSAIAGLGLLVSTPAMSQEATADAPAAASTEDAPAEETQPEANARQYWIGLACAETTAEQRDQAHVTSDHALFVKDVMPNSPAEKAGIKSGDFLIKAGDHTLAKIEDMLNAVTKPEEITVELVRDGETMTVKVTPERRPWRMLQNQDFLKDVLPGVTDREEFDILRRFFSDADGRRALDVMRFGPGVVVEEPLPDDVQVTVSKKGQEPAHVMVQKGDQTWEATEGDLGTIPEEYRPHVERMLMGHHLPFMSGAWRPRAARRPAAQGTEQATPGTPQTPAEERQMLEKARDEFSAQLERLAEERAKFEAMVRDGEKSLGKLFESRRDALEKLLSEKAQDLEKLLNKYRQELDRRIDKSRTDDHQQL